MRELYGFDTNIAKLYGINAAIIAQFLKVNANSEKGATRFESHLLVYLYAFFAFSTR